MTETPREIHDLEDLPRGGEPPIVDEEAALRSGLRPEYADWYVKNHQGEDPVTAYKRYRS